MKIPSPSEMPSRKGDNVTVWGRPDLHGVIRKAPQGADAAVLVEWLDDKTWVGAVAQWIDPIFLVPKE